MSIITTAPGNHAPIGGVKVSRGDRAGSPRGPSGTEDIYKIYAESFNGRAALDAHSGRGAGDRRRGTGTGRAGARGSAGYVARARRAAVSVPRRVHAEGRAPITGMNRRIAVPSPGALEMVIPPPCEAIAPCTIARPSPDATAIDWLV